MDLALVGVGEGGGVSEYFGHVGNRGYIPVANILIEGSGFKHVSAC